MNWTMKRDCATTINNTGPGAGTLRSARAATRSLSLSLELITKAGKSRVVVVFISGTPGKRRRRRRIVVVTCDTS